MLAACQFDGVIKGPQVVADSPPLAEANIVECQPKAENRSCGKETMHADETVIDHAQNQLEMKVHINFCACDVGPPVALLEEHSELVHI